jgi:hypothetical protein
MKPALLRALLLACFAALGSPSAALAAFTQCPTRTAQPGGVVTAAVCSRRAARGIWSGPREPVILRAAATGSSDFYTEESEGGNGLQDWAAGAPNAPGDALLQSKKLQLLALVAGLDRGAAAGGLQRKVTTRIWRALHALNARAAVCHASPRGDELWATCLVALCRRCWRPRRRWSVRALWASILKSPIYSDLIQ